MSTVKCPYCGQEIANVLNDGITPLLHDDSAMVHIDCAMDAVMDEISEDYNSKGVEALKAHNDFADAELESLNDESEKGEC